MKAKTDYLRCTFPLDRIGGLEDELSPLLLMSGAEIEADGLYRFYNRGTVRMKARGRVLTLGFSGAALDALRMAALFDHVLVVLSDYNAKVTGIDACVDVPADAPPVLLALYQDARAGLIKLTQKQIQPKNVSTYFRPSQTCPGIDTGTVYLGTRRAEVHAKVYDKRDERLCAGVDDPGPLIRYELTVSDKQNPTLKDVHDPTALFWHFMGRTVLQSPADVPKWTGYAENWTLPKVEPLLPYQKMKATLDGPTMTALLRLVAESGDMGEKMLLDKLHRLQQTSDSATSSKLASRTG